MTNETLLINALVRTMDPAQPQSDAVLIRDGRIVALGNAAHLAASFAAQRVDAGGRLVLPGFQDAHIHLLNGGTDLVETAQLYEATSLAELQAALGAHAAAWKGEMVWGAGWQCGFFGDANLSREVLDTVVPDRPCLIYDGNFHNACLNSKAVEMAGIGDETRDPLNGHIVRDALGHATGMLHEEAINWACGFLPETSDETLARGLLAGMAHANQYGITGVIDPWIVDRHVRIYGAAEAEDALTLRVAGACLITAADTVEKALTRLTALRAAHGSRGFHLNAAKFFLDGGLENGTAAMIEPYIGGGNAPLMFTTDQIAALFTALDAARFQIHVHCIGDMATHAALDGFQAARAANGAWPALHQIAHVEVVHPDDLRRFAELGVMANMQPLWAANDPIIPDKTMAMVADRMGGVYPFRSLIDAGAPWCISSDWAVTSLNPFEIIGTAVTREPPRRRGRAEVFTPAERITVAEAVLGCTRNAAKACWRGHYTGQISVGYSGDLIVLDRDIFACDTYEIAETEVMLTLFQGRCVHRHPGFGG
ncbi:MAG: amidohydrolase [Paracoccaceae bacterium]